MVYKKLIILAFKGFTFVSFFILTEADYSYIFSSESWKVLDIERLCFAFFEDDVHITYTKVCECCVKHSIMDYIRSVIVAGNIHLDPRPLAYPCKLSLLNEPDSFLVLIIAIFYNALPKKKSKS